MINIQEYDELSDRGVVRIVNVKPDFDNKTLTIVVECDLKTPTKLDFLLAYITLAIPAAMLARITRKITGRKGTPLERFCMDYYYETSIKLLAKES